MGLRHELKTGDGIVMGKNALVTVAEVHAPELHVAICRTRRYQCRVRRNVHAENWQLVSVQRQVKLGRKTSER